MCRRELHLYLNAADSRIEIICDLSCLLEELEKRLSDKERALRAPQGATLSPDFVWIVELKRIVKPGPGGTILVAVKPRDVIQRGGGAKKILYKTLSKELTFVLNNRWACLKYLFLAISGAHVLPAKLLGYDVAYIPAYVSEDGSIILEDRVKHCDNNVENDICLKYLCEQYAIAERIWQISPPSGAKDPLSYINYMNKLIIQRQNMYFVVYVESQKIEAPLRAVVLRGSYAKGGIVIETPNGEKVNVSIPPRYNINNIGKLSGMIIRHTLHYIPSEDPVEAYYYLALMLSEWMVEKLASLVHQAGKQVHLTTKPATVISSNNAVFEGLEWQIEVAALAASLQHYLAGMHIANTPRKVKMALFKNERLYNIYKSMNELIKRNLT